MNKLFLVRVELHGGLERDYQVLHAAMARIGLNRIVTNGSGVKFELPSAEYLGWLNSNVTAIKNLAKTAANGTGRTSWILAAETANLDWDLRALR
jgi:hypothetical protein